MWNRKRNEQWRRSWKSWGDRWHLRSKRRSYISVSIKIWSWGALEILRNTAFYNSLVEGMQCLIGYIYTYISLLTLSHSPKGFHWGFLHKVWLVTFTEESLNEKLHFCAVPMNQWLFSYIHNFSLIYNNFSLSRSLSTSNKFLGPLRVRDKRSQP